MLDRTALPRLIWLTLACWSSLAPYSFAQKSTPRDLHGDPLPISATVRLGSVRFRHAVGFTAGLAFLPDSKTVVSATENGAVRFWEASTGALVREFRTDPMVIKGITLSTDGKHVAVAGFLIPDEASDTQGEVRIHSAETGEWLHTLKRNPREVDRTSMAFTPDGKHLVSLSGHGGTLRIEEVATGIELLKQTFPGDNGPSVAVSPDGKQIAVHTGPNTEKQFVWSWQAGEEPRELKSVGMPNGGGQIVFSPDGKLVAWVGYGTDPVHVWNVQTDELVARLTPPTAEEYFTGYLTFHPDGKSLIVPISQNRQGRIGVWTTADWKMARTIDMAAASIAISPDGRLLATANAVVDFETGRSVGAIDAAHRGSITQIVANQPGTIVTASDDHTIRLWDALTGKQKLMLEHGAWVRSIALSPDGSQLVSSSLDNTVRLWNAHSGKEIYRLPGHGRLGGRRTVAFTPDGRRFATFGDDFYLRLYDVRNGKAIEEFSIRPTGIKIPGADDDDDFFHLEEVELSPDASRLAICVQRKIFVFDVASGRELQVLEHDGGIITSVTFAPDSKRLLVCAWGRYREIRLPGGGTRSTAARDHTAAIWNLDTGKVETTVLHPEGSISAGGVSPDGKRFAVASGRNVSKITVFDATGHVTAILPNISGRVQRLAFMPDGHSLVTALEDTTALVWGPESLVDPPPAP
jgi:WD40 repeat protein